MHLVGFGRTDLRCPRQWRSRDMVARVVHQVISKGGRVFLDARLALGSGFAQRFPGIHALCAASGIDPASDPIQVSPAAHYHMGGIAVERHGRSTLPGLWAVGECAATGLHGANRQQLSAGRVVMGRRAARDIVGRDMRFPTITDVAEVLPGSDPTFMRPLVSQCLGVIRDGAGLRRAISCLRPLVEAGKPASYPALVALAIAVFAELRQESRGGHFRSDFPDSAPDTRSHLVTLSEILAVANAPRSNPLLRTA